MFMHTLIFATAGAIQSAIALGKSIADRIAELEDADRLVAHLSRFGVESSRATLQLLFEDGLSVCRDPHVDDEVKEILDNTFVEIQVTLNLASNNVDSALAASKKKRKIFVERKIRQNLEQNVQQLKNLTQTFQDTVRLVRNERTSRSSTFLSKNVFRIVGGGQSEITDLISLQKCQLSIELGRTPASMGFFFLERRPYDSDCKEELEDDIKYLTKILSRSSHSEGILDLVGYANDTAARCFNLVFAMPGRLSFQETLKNMVGKTAQVPPLDTRVMICRQLAEAVLHVHQLGLVHKNISPANIAVMTPENILGSTSLEDLSVFVLNWQLVRNASDATSRAGEVVWWKGIYCHPKRQMEFAQDDYNIGHDIYSLGVCMLEVLAWKPMVEYVDNKPCVSSIFRDRARSLNVLETNRVRLCERGPKNESELCTADPFAVQKVLIDLAQTEIRAIAGTKLSKLIVSCLSCLEGGFQNLTFNQNNRIETGMNFMVAVKASLAQISI